MYPIRHWDPSFSSGLEKIILKCTQKNPDDRYQSCAELLYALEHYEEEEEGYKKVQNIKWYTFIMTVVLTVVMGICTLLSRFGMNNMTADQYEEYLNNASMESDMEEKYKYYKNAIALNPSNEEAYMDAVTAMQVDGVFDSKESEIIRQIVPSHLNDLEKNKEGYIQLAYELGMMYFYYSENGQDTQNAMKWLNIAIGNKTNDISEDDIRNILGDKKLRRAQILYNICQYYQNLGVLNKEGDYEGDYKTLWNDLSNIITANLAEKDNTVTALVMYNFMATQINQNAQHFIDAGVSKNDVSQNLAMIKQQMTYDPNNSYEKELYDKDRKSVV